MHQQTPALYWAGLILLALLMTMKYFPGLENEQAYAGNAFQTVFPDSFVGDTSLDPGQPVTSKPLRLSLLYLFPKLFGEIWLDDFFLAFFYAAIVAAALLGVDRIAVTLGLRHVYERGLVLLFFAKDHQLLTGKVLVAHHQDVNHSALAVPVIIWLIYLALARKHLLFLLAMSIVLVATSPRIALFPVLFAMLAKFAAGSRADRIAIAALSVLGVLVMYLFLFQLYPIPPADKLAMWEILKDIEGDDANAFVQDSLGNIWIRHGVWLALIVATLFFPGGDRRAYPGVRTIMAAALFMWAAHGLYINYAPDFLKVPFLISLVPARCLSLAQNIAYIALIAAAIGYLRENPVTPARLAVVGAGLGFLYLIGPGNYLMWTGLLAAVAAAGLGVVWGYRNWQSAANEPLTRYWPALLLIPLLVMTSLNFANAARNNADAWKSAWVHGVYGHNMTAKWIGIAEFFRDETPPGTSILPFHCKPPEAVCDRLGVNRALATRSGKAVSIPDVVGIGFNRADTWQALEEHREILADAGDALVRGNPEPLADIVDTLTPPPTHLVLPRQLDVNARIEDTLPFDQLRIFPDFIVYERRHANGRT
ncbi:MAG: hypothetical protein ACFE0S_09745 [Rhodospirillales bacterium]